MLATGNREERQMHAQVERSITIQTIVIAVEGTLDLDITQSWHRKPRHIRPCQAEIRIVDGVVTKMLISGPLVLKSGTASTETRETATYYHEDYVTKRESISSAPGWAQMLWREAGLGGTSWTFGVQQP
jgi:hypothetical protein